MYGMCAGFRLRGFINCKIKKYVTLALLRVKMRGWNMGKVERRKKNGQPPKKIDGSVCGM